MLDKFTASAHLRRVLEDITLLDYSSNDSLEFIKWRRDASVAIGQVFGNESDHLKDFDSVRFTPLVSSYIDPVSREASRQTAFSKGLERAIAILTSMIDEVERYWEYDEALTPSPASQPEPSLGAIDVFLIHGHDHGTKEAVARFLQSLDIDPIILHERPNQGRTIIEKFEEYAKTSYAIALLTPDDVGGPNTPNTDELKPRARQNVILEMGFFWGSLGRRRVAALLKDNLEIPSDYDGVVYIELDDSEGWQMKLARELKAAGFEIDLNRLL